MNQRPPTASFTQATCHLALAWVCSLLTACGGSSDDPGAAALRRAQEAAATPVALQGLPALHQCLSGLSQQLKMPKLATQQALNIACLVGTYGGKTTQGDDCFLQVDASQNRFTFGYGKQTAVIDWAEVAIGADGRPVHNLEATDLDAGRPGVQLTRLSAAPDALTETLALRAGLAHRAGPLGLPQISYQRVPQIGETLDVHCRFAA